MDKARRDEARKRCEAATPGPWLSWDFVADVHTKYNRVKGRERKSGSFVGCFVSGDGVQCKGDWDNAVFVSHARTDLPAALDALDEADRRIAELEAEINRRDSMDAADIEVVAQTTGDLGAEVARLRLAVGVRDKAAIGGGPADKLGNFSCGYCGVIGINPCSNQCPTITHPLDKEGCR